MMTHSVLHLFRIVFAFLLAFTFLATAYMSSWLGFDVRNHIDIHAIKINDVYAGDPVHLEVARTLGGSWPGAYKVEVRKQPTGHHFCTTGWVEVDYSEFNADGDLTELPDPLTLEYWAWGGSCTERLKKPLREGLYSVETCHKHLEPRIFFIPLHPKARCWDVEVFRVLPRPNVLTPFTVFPPGMDGRQNQGEAQ